VIILTSSGVGYELLIHEVTALDIPESGEIGMYVYDHITENARSLFGFVKKEEKTLFTELLKISWAGGKVALQILSLGWARLVQAVSIGDNKTIEGIKWIGKKMAEKIILELKDKDLWMISITHEGESSRTLAPELHQSIKSTLVAMGYNPLAVDEHLANVPDEMNDASDILPYIIQQLS